MHILIQLENNEVADKWAILVKHFIKRVQSDFTRDALTVVDVGIVFSLALGCCLLQPSAVCWNGRALGILYWVWCDDLTSSNSLNLLKNHHMTTRPQDQLCTLHHTFETAPYPACLIWCNITETLRWVRFCFVTFFLSPFQLFWNRDHVIMRSLLCASFLVEDPDSVTLQINSTFTYYYDLLIYCCVISKATTEFKEIVHLQNTK